MHICTVIHINYLNAFMNENKLCVCTHKHTYTLDVCLLYLHVSQINIYGKLLNIQWTPTLLQYPKLPSNKYQYLYIVCNP